MSLVRDESMVDAGVVTLGLSASAADTSDVAAAVPGSALAAGVDAGSAAATAKDCELTGAAATGCAVLVPSGQREANDD